MLAFGYAMDKQVLTFHKIGARFNSPYNLSFLCSSHSSVLGIPEIGWRVLIWKKKEKKSQVVFIIVVFLAFCFEKPRQKKLLVLKKPKLFKKKKNWQKITSFTFTADRTIYAEWAGIYRANVCGFLQELTYQWKGLNSKTSQAHQSWLKLQSYHTNLHSTSAVQCQNPAFIPYLRHIELQLECRDLLHFLIHSCVLETREDFFFPPHTPINLAFSVSWQVQYYSWSVKWS